MIYTNSFFIIILRLTKNVFVMFWFRSKESGNLEKVIKVMSIETKSLFDTGEKIKAVKHIVTDVFPYSLIC